MFELLAQAAPATPPAGILESAVQAAVSQAPALVVLCFLVRLFLTRLREMDDAAAAREARVDSAFKEMLDAVKESGKVIATNTEVMRQAIEYHATHDQQPALPMPRPAGIGTGI